jgi:pimeloyl-ACP methyl ester carboxylesterase
MLPVHEKKIALLRTWMANVSPQAVIHAYQAIMTRNNSVPELASINVPTLIICGGEDLLTGEAVMQSMKEGIKDAAYHLIPSAGHLAPFDSPEETNQAFSKFLQGFHD